jgi:hypothetical protein
MGAGLYCSVRNELDREDEAEDEAKDRAQLERWKLCNQSPEYLAFEEGRKERTRERLRGAEAKMAKVRLTCVVN